MTITVGEVTSLSDAQLMYFLEKNLNDLLRTGGKSWSLHVPPSPTDMDILIMQIIQRYKNALERLNNPSKSLEEIERELRKAEEMEEMQNDLILLLEIIKSLPMPASTTNREKIIIIERKYLRSK